MTATATRPSTGHPSAQSMLGHWAVKNVSIRPFGPGWWSFNPSIHHDRATGIWRCALRLANYSLPGGVPHLSPGARAGRAETRNVIARLDPSRLELHHLHEVRELDDLPRSPKCGSLGYEDVRLFRADQALFGIATALQLNLDRPSVPEMVLLHLDDACDVVGAVPLRGSWSHRAQKNWSPFDGAQAPRFLYSIERGIVMSPDGPASGPSPTRGPAQTRPQAIVAAGTSRCGVDVKVMTSGAPRTSQLVTRPPAPGSTELRGGSQLISIGGGLWLSVAHEVKLLPPRRRKYYWHTLYACDDEGRMILRSAPFKLSPRHDIEFAAGLAIDGRGTVAISFGTDDHESWIGLTTLDAIMSVLLPVTRDQGDDAAIAIAGAR